jgi:sulfur dioxygenase
MLIFRQLFDPESSTYSYLVADSRTHEALLIDPVLEQTRRDSALIRELGLKLVATLETHVHADHVTGAWFLKQQHGSEIMLGAKSGAEGADRYLKQGDRVAFGQRFLEVRETPGHTDGCLTFVLDDESCAFTGDCLLIRGAGRTDFQQGSAATLYRSVHSQIFTLPHSCLLYPAHDYRGLTVSSVGEEQRFNPRLGGELSEHDFSGYMANLGLPHPKKIDIAVPANRVCGRPAGATNKALVEPTWAPLNYTFAGVWEIAPQWVEEHLNDVQVLDVREPDEFDGPLGHVPGAKLVPLAKLSQASAELGKGKPIVTVCRAGGRSARATQMLASAGFDRIANLAGGMLRWRAEHFPTEGGAD